MRSTRTISWVVPARKEFRKLPLRVQEVCFVALTIAAEGGKADIDLASSRLQHLREILK